MIYALLAIGALCAMLGAIYGRRASYALLASAALGLSLRWAGVEFELWLWLAVDFVVIATIWWPTGPRFWPERRDWLVLLLFLPIFANYVVPFQAGSDVSDVLVSLQMMLTLPVKPLAKRWKHTAINHHSWSDFDLRASHGEA